MSKTNYSFTETVLTILKTDSFNLQVKLVNYLECRENTQTAYKSRGQPLVVYKLFPLLVYCSRKPIISVFYCLTYCLCILHLFFSLLAATQESFSTEQKIKLGSGETRTHASEETGALNQCLRPLSHASRFAWIIICNQFAFYHKKILLVDFNPTNKRLRKIFKEKHGVIVNTQRPLEIIFMKKFKDNVRWDWLKSALSESSEQVDDFQLAFKILLWKFDKFNQN